MAFDKSTLLFCERVDYKLLKKINTLKEQPKNNMGKNIKKIKNNKVFDNHKVFRICANGEVYHRGKILNQEEIPSVIYGFKSLLQNIGYIKED